MHLRVKEIYMIMLCPEFESSINVKQAIYQLGMMEFERKLKLKIKK